MATYSSIPAWETPRTEEPGGLRSMGVAKSQTQMKRLSTLRKHVVSAIYCQMAQEETSKITPPTAYG